MSEGTKYSTIGGLVGLLVTEGFLHLALMKNGGEFNQPLRIYTDMIGYALFSAIGSYVATAREERRVSLEEGRVLTVSDYINMLGNTLAPAAIGIAGLIKHDGEMPFIH